MGAAEHGFTLHIHTKTPSPLILIGVRIVACQNFHINFVPGLLWFSLGSGFLSQRTYTGHAYTKTRYNLGYRQFVLFANRQNLTAKI